MRARCFLVVAVCACLLTPSLASTAASAAPLILNEYNAVSAGNFLNGGDAASDSEGGMAADSQLGRIQGNGGDWFEMVIIEEGLDLRGYQLEIFDEGAPNASATLAIGQAPLFASLRAGTILTIAESPLEELVVTDTIPLQPDAVDCEKLQVVTVAPLLSESIRRINNEESVSSLFI